MTRRGFASRIRLGLAVLACVGFLGMATQARAGGTIMVIPGTFTTDEAYDANGDKVKTDKIVVPNLGLLFSYSIPLKGVGPEDWGSSLSVTMLYWFAKVDTPAGPGQWSSIFAWPIVSFGSKYLDFYAGYQLDLGADGAEALTLGGTVKYPIGNFSVAGGVDYYWTFQQEDAIDQPNWFIVRGTGTYSFKIAEGVNGSIGATVAYYFFSESPALGNDNGNVFLIRPQIGISYEKFSFTVMWGSVDEYTSGGISFSGKNTLVKKATGFRAFIGYSF
jgi:hypothetical protein